ncbi:NADPH-dependent glutamate synthase [Deferribacterales bacterium RsTz2092]|nr:glutamate synthase (NADPH), homotetrameric [Deferribacterales bacterium]
MPQDMFKRVELPKQLPDERRHNFSEVSLGYTIAMAQTEASRCLECPKPLCRDGCPVGIQIPQFIHFVKGGDFESAYNKIAEDSNLPAICGRVCPQEEQCEKRCVRGIKGDAVSIGALERFVADWYMNNKQFAPADIKQNGKRVAVVGAGPSGLTCAADLAKRGYSVTVFEALHKAGGVLSYGIPEFRLPKALVAREIKNLETLGVKFETNVVIGKSVTVDELFADGFRAVFIGSGAGLPTFMNIEGENLNGVYAANEYLTRSNLMKAYSKDSTTPIKRGGRVAVVGAGNVAMDSARTALRLGASEVTIVYRRGKDEMPAREEEIENAVEEGVKLQLLTAPVEVIGKNFKVAGLRCQKMELGEADVSGRRRPTPVKGSEFVLNVETVIVAIGQSPNPLLCRTTSGLNTHKWGGIIVNEETMESSKPNVYAGGDAVTGAATVILAMGAGRKATKAIDERLKG